MNYDVIIDCYTDEPSGLGVPPYLGVHSRYLAGSLKKKGKEYYYLTIDDIRVSNGETHYEKGTWNKRIINTTKNKDNAQQILSDADNIYVVMGCFVEYEYVSAFPPSFKEVEKLLEKYSNKNKVLFYALGGSELSQKLLNKTIPDGLFNEIIFGNVYNYFFDKENNKFSPNYDLLREVAILSADMLKQLSRPMIIELESATGCNRKPGCTFCIESIRGLPLQFRDLEHILQEVKALYDNGARYLRIGKQPNFYAYMNCDPDEIEKLLKGIRELCPELKTFHIDNVSPHNVPTREGERITELIVKYCTSGNIAPFGVESFDPKIREVCNLNGSLEDVHNSIAIINKYGKERGEDGMPKFLPGINIIYGLSGQGEKTLKYNLDNFKRILESDCYVRRVFVRKLTSPYGEQFDEHQVKEDGEFEFWKAEIEKNFIFPMLKKVYPIGLELRDIRMEMYKDGNSILRKMGTCPIRILIEGKELIIDEFYNVKVIGYVSERTLLGEII